MRQIDLLRQSCDTPQNGGDAYGNNLEEEAAMHSLSENKRISGRRKETRRVYDMLDGTLVENERQLLDRLFYGGHMSADRRMHTRRSGVDRRQ